MLLLHPTLVCVNPRDPVDAQELPTRICSGNIVRRSDHVNSDNGLEGDKLDGMLDPHELAISFHNFAQKRIEPFGGDSCDLGVRVLRLYVPKWPDYLIKSDPEMLIVAIFVNKLQYTSRSRCMDHDIVTLLLCQGDRLLGGTHGCDTKVEGDVLDVLVVVGAKKQDK